VSLSLSVSSNTQFCSFIDLSDSYRYSYFWDDDDEDGGGGVGEDDDSDGDVKLNVSWVEWPTKVTYVQEVFLTQDQAGLNTSDRQNYQSPCSKQSHIIQTANVHFQLVLLWLDICSTWYIPHLGGLQGCSCGLADWTSWGCIGPGDPEVVLSAVLLHD